MVESRKDVAQHNQVEPQEERKTEQVVANFNSTTQIITNDLQFINFMPNANHFVDWDPSLKNYKVVAIVGAQSTGKSYLLNELFNTDFKVNEDQGSQTTQGVWVKAMKDQQRIIIDVEGSNSGERNELSEETEKQLACFALAVSDLVILNIQAAQLFQQSSGLNLI